jgi:hypothetical protein
LGCTWHTTSVVQLVEDQAELLETYRPRQTIAIPHGQDISRRALAMLHRNAFDPDSTHAGSPGPGFRCVHAAMSLLTRILEDPRWASSGSSNVAKPANATRSEQHHCNCGAKLAVTWRVPGQWKHDTFPRFGCTRDAFRGCHLCPSGRFGRNATHSGLHNRVEPKQSTTAAQVSNCSLVPI